MPQTGLGAALRRLRERRTLSLRETSQLSEVDHAYVYRLETGEKANPSEELVAKLIRVLKPTEREVGILKWLIDHPKTRPDLVELAMDDETIDVDTFSTAASFSHRANVRPDPATLIDRARKFLSSE